MDRFACGLTQMTHEYGGGPSFLLMSFVKECFNRLDSCPPVWPRFWAGSFPVREWARSAQTASCAQPVYEECDPPARLRIAIADGREPLVARSSPPPVCRPRRWCTCQTRQADPTGR